MNKTIEDNKYESFENEVKFQVGKRVWLDITEIPQNERETDTGVITDIKTRFPLTAKYRRITYTVKLDNKGYYTKKEFRTFGAIRQHFSCSSEYLKDESEKPVGIM